jgi:hypothetical protein
VRLSLHAGLTDPQVERILAACREIRVLHQVPLPRKGS